MSDTQRAADAEKAIDATKAKLWTPDQKVPESVRKMAFLFFLETWKAFVNSEDENSRIESGEAVASFDAEACYRHCIKMARAVHKVDAENDPK
jgi:hypothetical protein